MFRILTNFDMDSWLVLSLVIAGQTPLRALLAHDEQEAMARRIIHYVQLRLLSRDEVAHCCVITGAVHAPFDDRSLDAIFEISRGNLRATDDLAFKSLAVRAMAEPTTAATTRPAASAAHGPRFRFDSTVKSLDHGSSS